MRLADADARPERRAPDRRRSAGDDRDRPRRDARRRLRPCRSGEFTSQTEQITKRFAQERLFALAYSAFGALALVLACIGLFGLMSYNVSRRTNEIGVRMALGAQRPQVVGMVMRESMLLVGIGVAVGLAARAVGRPLRRSVLYGLPAHDPLTIVGAVAVDRSWSRRSPATCRRVAPPASIRWRRCASSRREAAARRERWL